MAIKNLYKFLESVVTTLFEPEERRLNSLVAALDKANRELKGHTTKGFIHAGEAFIPAGEKQARVGLPSLSFSLSNKAAEFMGDRQTIVDDRKLVLQVLWLAAKDCGSIEDVRNALPETIVNLSNDLKAIPRSNEDGYTLKGNKRLYTQYLSMRDKIDVYWACRMIY